MRLMLILLALAGTAKAQINYGHSGAWFNPDTAGQGLLVEVLPDSNQVFVAWFTFETAGSKLGAPEQRWLTGQGEIIGDTANLMLSVTAGGVFDDPTAVTTTPVGSAMMTLPDCVSGRFDYQLDSDGLAGGFDLQRIGTGATCQELAGDSSPGAEVTITHLSNEGVLISDGDNAVVIDGLTRNTAGWVTMPLSEIQMLEAGTGAYAGVDVAMVTHNHGDHFSFASINAFLAANPDARFIGTTQMIGGVGNQAQTVGFSPPRFSNETMTVNGITITVFNTRHFNQFSFDFSGVENYAYLVEIGGKRILHTGDIDYARDNFEAMGLADNGVDAVILPTFNLLINNANFALVEELFNPDVFIAAHFQSSALQSEVNRVQAIVPDAVIFDEPLDSVVLP